MTIRKVEAPDPDAPVKRLFTIGIVTRRTNIVRLHRYGNQEQFDQHEIPIRIMATSSEEAEAYLEARLQELLGKLR